MAEPVKYLFDRNLDPGYGSDQKAEHEAALAAARTAGIAEGRRLAGAEAEARFAAQSAPLAAAISAHLAKIDAAIVEYEAAAATLAMTVARSLASNLVAAQPLEEVHALFKDCIGQLHTAPHLAIRLNDAIVEVAQERLEPIAAQTGYEGRLIIIGDPDISAGDCRIEWAEGSIVRSLADIDATVHEKVTRYIAARSAATEDEANE